MEYVKLKNVATVDISNVDKKTKSGEKAVRLCNFVDVYKNWAITTDIEGDFMTASANDAQINKFQLGKGQVAITKDSETRDDIGVSTYIADNIDGLVLGYHCALITPSETLDGAFLNVLFHTEYAQRYFEANASGSGQRYTLTNEIIENFPVPVVDINKQKEIGDFFSCIDKKIVNNEKLIEEIETYLSCLFKYWFIQFDFPDANGNPYRTSGGKMKWNDTLKRDIPETWDVRCLDNCIETIIDHRGRTPKKMGGDWVDNGIIALSAKTVKKNRLVNLDDANMVSEEMYERWMPEELEEEDILMTSEAPLGEFYFLFVDTKYCLSQRLYAIRAKKDIVDSTYLYGELSMGHGNSQIMGKQSGSTVFGIRQDELRLVNIVVPTKDLQDKYHRIAHDLYRYSKILELENIDLIRIRKTITPLLAYGIITM